MWNEGCWCLRALVPAINLGHPDLNADGNV